MITGIEGLLFYHSDVNFVVSSGYDNYYQTAESTHYLARVHTTHIIYKALLYIILYYIVQKYLLPIRMLSQEMYIFLSKYLSLPVRPRGLSTTGRSSIELLLLPHVRVCAVLLRLRTPLMCD